MAYTKKIIFSVVLIGLLMPALALANDKIKLLPLEPLPKKSVIKSYEAKHPYSGYNKKGRIDSVRGNEVVINDTLRFITSSTQFFYSPDNAASRSMLSPGQFVMFRLDKKNRIIKIMLQKK